MLTLESMIKSNDLSHKDIIVYLLIEKFELRTVKELSRLSDCNYSRLTESIRTLLKLELIEKTKEYPARFIINDNKDN